MDIAAYIADARTQAAVERKFEVIGEAVNRLQQLHPDFGEKIPRMRKIIDFRNPLAHGYERVVPERIWDYAQNYLPQLHQTVRTLLIELEQPKE